jgi:guanosine-3',5'-bis(diphosphate) 3'-pyrophosphohydrolase
MDPQGMNPVVAGPAQRTAVASGASTDVSSDVSRLLEAISFAAEKHRNQRRKDKEASPYINHPIALASLLTTVGGITDLAVLQAAILHDTVEDTDTSYEELVAHFGRKVADIVMEVTDDKQLEKPRRKALQIEHAPHASHDAALVKLADKTCNLRDVVSSPPDRWTLERRREYFDWAVQVVDGLPRVSEPLLAAFKDALSQRP